jgi:CHAT domain-containing protein
MDQYDSAFYYLQKCLDKCLELWGENYLLTTMCLNKLSFCYWHNGDFQKYRDYQFRSFEIRRRILDSNDTFLNLAYSNIGGYYYIVGDKAKNELFAQKSNNIVKAQFEIYSKSKDPLNDEKLQRLQGGMPEFPNNTKYLISLQPRLYIENELTEATNFAHQGEFAKVKSKLKTIDSLENKYIPNQTVPNPRKYFIQIELNKHTNQLIHADAYTDSLITMGKKLNNFAILFDAYKEKCLIASKLGHEEQALKILSQDTIFKSLDLYKTNEKLRLMAQIYYEAKNYCYAIQVLDSLYKLLLSPNQYSHLRDYKLNYDEFSPMILSELMDDIKLECSVLFDWYSDNTTSVSTKEKAIKSFDLYNHCSSYLQERNFSEEGKLAFEPQYYLFTEKAINFANKLYFQTHDKKYIKFILKWSEIHKSITLKGLLSTKKNEIDPLFFADPYEKVTELQHQIESIKIRLKKNEEPGAKEDSLINHNLTESLVNLNSELDIFIKKNENYLHKRIDPDARIDYPLENIQDYLKQNESTLIDFFVGEHTIQISLIDANHIYSLPLELCRERKDLIDSLIKVTNTLDYKQDYRLISKAVYNFLILPIADKIKTNHIIIIPDGILFKLPFDALECSENKKLIDQYSIHYEYSSMSVFKKVANHSEHLYTGFAPTYTGKEEIKVYKEEDQNAINQLYSENRALLGNLKFNVPEVVAGAEIMHGRSFIGDEVTKETFKHNSKGSRILHLAMHAITNNQNPDYSQLFFVSHGSHDPLFAYELKDYPLNSELAILSACNTGVGKYVFGSGVQSIARAFKIAGCQNTVFSLWAANDASTKEIVTNFLKRLKQGLGKADALRQAKLDYLLQAPQELRHPYYWAGLVLIGDNKIMDLSTHNWKSIFLTFTFILLISFYLYKIFSYKHTNNKSI